MKQVLTFAAVFIMLATGITACSGTEKTNTENTMDTVFGTAENSPDGAIIINKSGFFLVEDKTTWENEFLQKRVQVTGTIRYYKAENGKSYNGHSAEMRSIRINNITLAK